MTDTTEVTTDPYSPTGIVYMGLECETLDELEPYLRHALASDDPWVLNAGILALGHAARRLKTYPKALKDQLWARCYDFADAPQLTSSRSDVDGDIRHFKAMGV